MGRDALLKEAATHLVREALNGHVETMILRGADEFAREGGDIDVIVPRNKAKIALLRTAERAAEEGWRIIGIRDIGYLAQLCLAKRLTGDDQYCAVKIDFFKGASWCALGKDPLMSALFKIRYSNGERQAVGLASLLQKLLYAGYLRERDWVRITSACDLDWIERFVAATNLPLSRTSLEHGSLSKINRWRLRAASSGAQLPSVPAWIAQVIWRRIRFGFIRSNLRGMIIIVEGTEQDRWKAVATRFRSLLAHTGFPRPVIVSQSGANCLKVTRLLLDQWHTLRGDTVLTGHADAFNVKPGTPRSATLVRVRLTDYASKGNDDLDALIANVSEHALSTLRKIGNQ